MQFIETSINTETNLQKTFKLIINVMLYNYYNKKIEAIKNKVNLNKEDEKENNNDIYKYKIEELKDQISELKDELNKEKENNNKLELKIKELNDIIEEYKSKKQESNKESTNISETKETLYQKILQKDDEINELKKKLERFPFELKENEKLMTVNFMSVDQKIKNYSIICKNTDRFNKVENQLYEDNKDFYETENYFTVNGSKVHKNKTLDENNIHNNDIVLLEIINLE